MAVQSPSTVTRHAGCRYMNHMIYATALHQRTSENESFFHLVDTWLPMWANFSDAGYALGVRACVLTFNEQHRSKMLTVGKIEKTKSHPDGILRRHQQRSILLEWRLRAKERLFPRRLVGAGIIRDRKKMANAVARRTRYVMWFLCACCVLCDGSCLRRTVHFCIIQSYLWDEDMSSSTTR